MTPICTNTADQAQNERIECVHDYVHGVGKADLQPCQQIDEGDELESGFHRESHDKHG